MGKAMALEFARRGALECVEHPVNLSRLAWMLEMVTIRRSVLEPDYVPGWTMVIGQTGPANYWAALASSSRPLANGPTESYTNSVTSLLPVSRQ